MSLPSKPKLIIVNNYLPRSDGKIIINTRKRQNVIVFVADLPAMLLAHLVLIVNHL